MSLMDRLMAALGGGRSRQAPEELGSAEFRRRHATLESVLGACGLGAIEKAIRTWIVASGAAGGALYDERGIPVALARSGAPEPEGLSDPARLWSLFRRDGAPGTLKVTRQPRLTVVAGRIELAGASWHLVTWHTV
jgi:hypothetical protein